LKILLAIGMAGHDPVTGFPAKPEVKIDNIPRLILSRTQENPFNFSTLDF